MKIFVRFSSKSFFTKNIILHYNTTYWFDYQKKQLEELEIETTPAFGLFGPLFGPFQAIFGHFRFQSWHLSINQCILLFCKII
jgi:hypothetical protein